MPASSLPRLNRVAFFRSTETDLVHAVAGAIEDHTGKLAPRQEAVAAWSSMIYNVQNGGFVQFFHNRRGDRGVEPLAKMLDEFELPKAAEIVRQARAVYRKHKAAFAVTNPWDGLFGGIKAFDKLDEPFLKFALRGTRAFEMWIRANIATLVVDESGRPFDPKFTGTVEIRDADGTLRESLDVKNGKPHGAYRDYFEDGTVREAAFYKSGKLSADFWPDGRLKRREFKRGPLTVIEWHFPGGAIQKRYVKNKDGYAAEPIRLFHENGQLAEELTTVEGDKTGPWVKFFPDGSPKLRAEFKKGEKLIVHDAWNDDRVQVVKDGSGTYRDDGRVIDWHYDVNFVHNWQHETELKDGIAHGKRTTFHDGVLWSISQFANGVQEGEAITYWDNGRIRDKTRFTRGKAGNCREFPKFDRPVPAVVMTIEADEKLYTEWRHLRVDEYPRPLNLDAIRLRLVLPQFLREVDERNRTGKLKDDYEDWNTFDDGIAYFLEVNESGETTEVNANGSGIYSGGEWETYRPLLSELRFSPGRIRSRAVKCRVLAWVKHTFVEAP